jgi:hypothetical protein
MLRGDARLFNDPLDLFVTTVGARYVVNQQWQVELLESIRFSGDNATQLGIRTEITPQQTAYTHQRFIDQFDQQVHTSVVGAEHRFAKGARVFSEYQLESGVLGQRNRAVLGVGKRTKLFKGLMVDAGYQRSQVLDGVNDLSQDALTLGIEWLARKDLKISSRIELRFDDRDDWLGRRDQEQFLTLNSLNYQLNPDLTLQLRFNYSHTLDVAYEQTQAAFVEAGFGLAYRPIRHRWLTVLFKAASRFEQRPVDLSVELPEREEMEVVSIIPIFELPYHFQLVEKVAYKRSALALDVLPSTISHSLLWINRLNYHLAKTVDLGIEYRFLQNTLAQNVKHGALLEANYIIKDLVRLGVGYNFTDFSDQEFARFDEQFGGPFFRVVSHY